MKENGGLTREKISIVLDLFIKLKKLVAEDKFFKEGAEKATTSEAQLSMGSVRTKIADVVCYNISVLIPLNCPVPQKPSQITEFIDVYEEFLDIFEQKLDIFEQ